MGSTTFRDVRTTGTLFVRFVVLISGTELFGTNAIRTSADFWYSPDILVCNGLNEASTVHLVHVRAI